MPDNIWKGFMEIVGPYSMMFINKAGYSRVHFQENGDGPSSYNTLMDA